MTLYDETKNHTRFKTEKALLMSILLVFSMAIVTSQQSFAATYGYSAVKAIPNGAEVKGVQGDVWTYIGSTITLNKHIDRLIYLTDTGTNTIGAGYWIVKDGSGEHRHWLKYRDQSSPNDNVHTITTDGPTNENWRNIKVEITSTSGSTKTFTMYVDGVSKGTITCTSCPNFSIVGATSWGEGTTSDYANVNGNFNNLKFKRTNDSSYVNWQGNTSDLKCENIPDSSVAFQWPLTGNSQNQVIFDDAASGDECEFPPPDTKEHPAWLYNGGFGG